MSKTWKPKQEEFLCNFCGNKFMARPYDVQSGHKKSCGCQKTGRPPVHGLSSDPLLDRCHQILRIAKKGSLFIDPKLNDALKIREYVLKKLKPGVLHFIKPEKGIRKANLHFVTKSGGPKAGTYDLDGGKYTIKQLSVKLGLSEATVWKRLKIGKSLKSGRYQRD